MALAPSALAGSGDSSRCRDYVLNPQWQCLDSIYHNTFIEVESWNSDGKYQPTCAVDSTDNQGLDWYGSNCTGDGTKYEDTYCTRTCAGGWGYDDVMDNGPNTSVFTVWGEWQ
jgi:hypothetical protein